MANRVQRTELGVDVAKDELVIYRSDCDSLTRIPNTKPQIKAWLRSLPAQTAIALEPTNAYHYDVTELAHAAGFDVFVIDGYRLNNYRKGIGQRAKTDPCDARLLARYLKNEGDEQRPWSPPPPAYRKLQSLLRRRAVVVKSLQCMQLSLDGEPALKAELAQIKRQLGLALRSMEKKIHEALREANLLSHAKRIQAIEGIGPLTAAGLIMAFIRGDFTSSDAFIAFLGLDLRVSDSGRKQGQRCLSKRGCGEIRRLLHNAGMSASRTAQWKGFYEHHRARGLATTQVLVMLARKLARVAFALMKGGTEYQAVTRSYGATVSA
ncbi:IS110 family transposase [Pseudomonas sp. KNUC1026]|uniref:IS110 family transposase n=1 Tax=Pseudomonas sp. KNUC1026 TaxID=2893890 RepID=UPI001F1791A5|nr:IS110 family transposase [Pseudomonas sp. KNUC1026]UFH49910.1 IS110 family transposase [Pseudomonas sp. KNUC1026]